MSTTNTENTPTTLRIDVPEGPARAALLGVYQGLERALVDLQRRALRLQADAASRAHLILSGAGHALDLTRARSLRITEDASAVLVDLAPEDSKPVEPETHDHQTGDNVGKSGDHDDNSGKPKLRALKGKRKSLR